MEIPRAPGALHSGPPITRNSVAARGRATGLSSANEAPCSRMSIVRFAHGPKRSIGHLLRGEKNIFFNSRLHNHKVTVRDEKKVKPLTKIKDILDTRIEKINDKNNPISTFMVVVTTILMSKWWVLKNGEKKGVA